jgi:molecular chaperone DnaJ
MPRLQGLGSGDMHVKVRIKTPSALTERQRQLLEALAAEFGEMKTKQTEKEKSFIDKIVDEVKSAVQ